MVVGWAGVAVGLTRHYPGVVAAPRRPGSPSGGDFVTKTQPDGTESPPPSQSILFGFSYFLAVFHSPFPGASLRL